MRFRANGHSSQALVSWFTSLSRSRQLALTVLGAHLALIAALLINHLLTGRPQPKRPIGVRTITIKPAEFPSAPTSSTRQLSPPARVNPVVKKESAVKKEKIIAKPEPKKVPAKTNGKETPQIDEGILKQLSESFHTVIAPAQQPRQHFAPSLPSAIVTKAAIDPVSASAAPSYGEAFAAVLQNSLDLPEFGEVIAKIEIEADGRVSGVEILSERNRKNAEFLKNRLQELLFPCFNEFGLSEKRLNFTVTFRNVENR